MGISEMVALSRDQYLKVTRETEKPPAIARVESVVKAITSNPGIRSHSTARIAVMIFDEAVLEIQETGMDDQDIADWILVFGEIFKWCATGDDSLLPETVRGFLGTGATDPR